MEIKMYDALETLGEYAFSGCTALTSVTISAGLTSIPAGAFAGSGLTSVEIPYNIEFIYEGAFKNCAQLKTVTLLEGVQAIYANAFEGCSAMTKIEIPFTVSAIDATAFLGCGAVTFDIASNNAFYKVENGALYTTSGELVFDPASVV